MKRVIFLFVSSVLASTLYAQNNPERSDVVWTAIPDHADWLYDVGEKAKVEVTVLHYGMPLDGVEVEYELGADLMPADVRGSVVLKNGRAIIPMGTMAKAGFRDCRMVVEVDGARYKHHVKVGFGVDKIAPYTSMPKDFDAFWADNKAELARFPLQYTKQLHEPLCTEQIDCYLIKLMLNRRQAVYGYLFYPKGAEHGKHPVVFCPPGAGVKTIKNPKAHNFYVDEGAIRLEIDIHGLNPTMSDELFTEISNAFSSKENGYLTSGLDNRDNYYMRRVYLACVRSIDLLTSLPEWDGKNVVVQGGSQGGALAIITAALDERVTLCVANHPALSDMARFKAGEADGYPHFSKVNGMDTPEKIATMAYYDVVNFAKKVKVPTRITWGFNDNVCPPTTSYAVYNVMTCPKQKVITPVNEHWTSAKMERDHWEWIKQNLK